MITFNRFLKWEKTTKDTIDFKKIYVDMADGDPIAGLALSQIVFWHLPDKHGKNKMRVFREGYWWIAKPREDWWEECRLSTKRVDRALKILRDDTSLVVVKNFKFGPQGSPTLHIRINEENFIIAWEKHLGPDILVDPDPIPLHTDSDDEDEAGTEGKSLFTERAKRDLPSAAIVESSPVSAILNFPKGEVPFHPNGKKEFAERSTSTSTENTFQRTQQRSSTSQAKEIAAQSIVVDVVDSSNIKSTPKQSSRLQVLESLLAQRLYEIGLRPRKFCEEAVRSNRAVARRQAKWWKFRQENDAKYLRDHGTNAGAVLRRCIEEDRPTPPAWEIAQEKRQSSLRARSEKAMQEQRDSDERALAEALEFEDKVRIGNAMKRFDEMAPKKQREVLAEIAARNEFLNSRAGGDLRSIKPGCALWVPLVQSIGAVLQEWDANQPKLPTLDQRAAGELFDEVEATPDIEPRKVRDAAGFSSAANLVPAALAAKFGAEKAAEKTESRKHRIVFGHGEAMQFFDELHADQQSQVLELTPVVANEYDVEIGNKTGRNFEIMKVKALRRLIENGTIEVPEIEDEAALTCSEEWLRTGTD